MTTHPVHWTSPQPLWGRFQAAGASAFRAEDQARPALLRFATDEFMDQIIAMLESDPRRIGDIIARPETWRNPAGEEQVFVEPVRLPRVARTLARLRAGATAPGSLAPTTAKQTVPVNGVHRPLPLKLYHPAHQRFYLVAANLVCRIPGFPDHTLATGGKEQVGFVLRRLLPESNAAGAPVHEYAFVKDARGPHWERVPRDDQSPDPYARSVRSEEMLPLFPIHFSDDVGYPRRLLAGLVPVARREEYMGSRKYEAALPPNGTTPAVAALTDGSSQPQTKKSARKEQFKFDVSEPWKALIRSAYKAAERIDGGEPPDDDFGSPLDKRRKSTRESNEGAQLQSWLILLDFADYLAHHVPAVWAAVIGSASSPTGLDDGQQRLFDWINGTGTKPGDGWRLEPAAAFATNMRHALQLISAIGVREGLEGAERTFVAAKFNDAAWPKFYYLLAGVRERWEMHNGVPRPRYDAAGIQNSLDTSTGTNPEDDDVEATPQSSDAEVAAAHVDKLVQLVMGAVDANATTSAPAVPFAAQLRDAITSTNGDPGWFVIRCAYNSCDCRPLEPTVLSVPSQKFQLASFFDSDAPARPIRIALPIDTTAAGMRKHQKNTAFVMSDVLCGQVNRLKGLGFIDLVLSVLPWPFHKDLNLGQDGLGPCNDKSGNLGMICSLSIPIITICALILLFMIVLVFDLIFKWIPWFIICFPLRMVRAKQAEA